MLHLDMCRFSFIQISLNIKMFLLIAFSAELGFENEQKVGILGSR